MCRSRETTVEVLVGGYMALEHCQEFAVGLSAENVELVQAIMPSLLQEAPPLVLGRCRHRYAEAPQYHSELMRRFTGA